MKKRKKVEEWGLVIDAPIDVNVADVFFKTAKQRRVILRRAVEGAVRCWTSLPIEDRAKLICQRQQLGSADRRISSFIDVRVADIFFQQVEDYGCSVKDAFEAAIRCWINLSIAEQRKSIRREKH